MERYLICDLDGCLIETSYLWMIIRTMKFTQEEGFDFFDRTANAEANPIDETLHKYLCFKLTSGLKILFLTARSEKIETETINFIQKKTDLVYGRDFIINSRPLGDDAPAVQSKEQRLIKILAKDPQIVLAIDDQEEICKMYERYNIKTLKWKIGYVPNKVISEFNGNLIMLINKKELECLN